MTWLRALITGLRRLPGIVRDDHRQLEWEAALRRRLAAESAVATWICPLHGDAWRRPDGSLMRVSGTWILPLSEGDAEDFHGYGSDDPKPHPLSAAISEQLARMAGDER